MPRSRAVLVRWADVPASCADRVYSARQVYRRTGSVEFLHGEVFAYGQPLDQSYVLAFALRPLADFAAVYFEKFHPQLPIIHLPTFEPRDAAPLLLASLICIGANYSNLAGSRGFCIDLIEVLRKTLNALFENDSMNVSAAGASGTVLIEPSCGVRV